MRDPTTVASKLIESVAEVARRCVLSAPQENAIPSPLALWRRFAMAIGVRLHFREQAPERCVTYFRASCVRLCMNDEICKCSGEAACF